jgi:antirestriction protein
MVFEAYVTNLGKYNEGVLAGAYLKFPATAEDVQSVLKRIGVDGVRYEEIFITDFESDVLGLYDYLNEYDNIDELNHLAHVLSELDTGEMEKFEAVINMGEHASSTKELINLAQNLDCYDFCPDIKDDDDLGRHYIEELDAMQVPEHLRNYIDYEAYGRDVRLEEGGHFAPGGYVVDNGGSFVELYSGRDDIPDEHRIFAYPKLNIRETLSAYKEVIDRSALDTEKRRLAPAKEER